MSAAPVTATATAPALVAVADATGVETSDALAASDWAARAAAAAVWETLAAVAAADADAILLVRAACEVARRYEKG